MVYAQQFGTPSAFSPCPPAFLGQIVEGMPLADKSRLKYCMKGHLSLWVSLAVVALLQWWYEWTPTLPTRIPAEPPSEKGFYHGGNVQHILHEIYMVLSQFPALSQAHPTP